MSYVGKVMVILTSQSTFLLGNYIYNTFFFRYTFNLFIVY